MLRLPALFFTVAATLAGPANSSAKWDQLVSSYIKGYASIKEPRPVAYPQMADRLRTLFHGRKVSHVQLFAEKNGKRQLRTDIYYRSGELHIIQHVEGWSLVTKGPNAYEWEVGKKQGLITRATTNDLVDYLMYVTDPSYIMTAMYHDYLTNPKTYHNQARAEGDCIKLTRKEHVSPFNAIFVVKKPFWFCGFQMSDPGNGRSAARFFSQPKSIKEAPQGVFTRLNGIQFRRSELSIRRHMVYL